MDIIRLLLMQLESDKRPPGLDDYPEAEILYNTELAIEAGLIEGETLRDGGGDVVHATLIRLTWNGHDFLDSARDETLWNKAKQTVMKPAASYTFEFIKEWLKAEIRARVGLPG